jgi:hypothetical protein
MSCARFIVAGEHIEPPDGLILRTYEMDGVHEFKARDRKASAVNELIIHESVTRSAASTVAVLKRRKLGVHLIVAPDGTVYQHADLATGRLAHAGGHNGPSVGVEVVNPYYPTVLQEGLPWGRVIDAPWAHRDRYVLPTPEQAEATAKLMDWLTSPKAGQLEIPRTWLGLRGGKITLGRTPDGETRQPGVYAHHYFGHADGAWLVLYAWLRLEARLPACAAYEAAVGRATGARRSVDISDLLPESVA